MDHNTTIDLTKYFYEGEESVTIVKKLEYDGTSSRGSESEGSVGHLCKKGIYEQLKNIITNKKNRNFICCSKQMVKPKLKQLVNKTFMSKI